MPLRTLLSVLLFGLAVSVSTGCTTAVVAGAAAAGGYVAHKEGYRVRNPVIKAGDSEKQDTEKE
jgi:hypothetical protein